MLLPALARAKEAANRIKCVNDLKQLELSVKMYADDNDSLYPPRTNAYRWPTALAGVLPDHQPPDLPRPMRSAGPPQTDFSFAYDPRPGQPKLPH